MKHSTSDSDHALLYESLLQLKDVDECRRFMEDLCTVTERTGASSATISRVNRCLQYGAEGYQTVLPRLDALWEETKTP